MKQRILFLCATNGQNSLIAEALLHRIDSQHFEATSAGIAAGRIHTFAAAVMDELGIDLSNKTLQSVQEVAGQKLDYVITLGEKDCGHSHNFQGAETIHWKLADPTVGSEDTEKQLREFRIVRDQIAQRLRLFVIVHVRPQR